MQTHHFNSEKAVNALLYVIENLGVTDYHKVFKTLYFAERKHLVEYGASLLGDDFMKMGYGPVPSKVYDIVKIASGKYNGLPLSEQFIHFVHSHIEAVPPYHLKALEKADLDFLAETEVECLDDAIKACRSVSFEGLTDLSHDSAWAGASLHGQMPVSEIARAGGADEDTIRYIEEGIENSEYFSL